MGEYPGFRVLPHPGHARLRHLEFDAAPLRAFFADAAVSVQELEYVPYMRFAVAEQLDRRLGGALKACLRAIVHDRASGGFTAGTQGLTSDASDAVKFATAVSHLIGPSNFDAMSGKYYARFTVEHADASDSYLRQAYHALTLHTDGTYVDEVTDWLLMMKIAERNAHGGESRLLHLDDWDELERFAGHPLAGFEYTYKSPPSKNVATARKRAPFFERDGRPCISFIDQFVHPETIEQAAYLRDLLESAERARATRAVALAPGNLIVLNNAFWLHGRAAFDVDPQLHRELLRQRGYFSPD